ncbi:MAG TPA: copper-binding protein [Luteimonas sp.]|nr:copper-binding protein [Luteimonas sp.]
MVTGLVAVNLLVACSAPSGDEAAQDPSAPAAVTAQAPDASDAAARHAAATGTITAIDPVAQTVTIDHGPVAALDWPAMTMTFQAPAVDLSGFEQGDRVSFQFSASGMAATVTALEHE